MFLPVVSESFFLFAVLVAKGSPSYIRLGRDMLLMQEGRASGNDH